MATTKVKEQSRSAVEAQTITASTTATLSSLTRSIYVGTAGNLSVKFPSGGSTVTFWVFQMAITLKRRTNGATTAGDVEHYSKWLTSQE